MKILVIASHPNLHESKVNKVWIDSLKKENNITVRVLDKLYKDKKIDILKEQEYLLQADRIIFQFPFYWYNIPSLLRNYFDEVFQYGWAYGPNGDALKNKEFLIGLSIGAPEYSYQGGGYNNFTITELLRPYEATANALQMIYLPYFAVFDTPHLTENDILNSCKSYIAHINNKDLNHRDVLKRLKELNINNSFINL